MSFIQKKKKAPKVREPSAEENPVLTGVAKKNILSRYSKSLDY
jgi:hypothetical protein